MLKSFQCIILTGNNTVHPSIVCNCFIPVEGFLLEPIPAGRGQGTPWTVHQLIAGPTLIAEAAMQGANCTSQAIWGSVSCSRTLQHAAQLSPGLVFEPAILWSLANLLYPLTYSRPSWQQYSDMILPYTVLIFKHAVKAAVKREPHWYSRFQEG